MKASTVIVKVISTCNLACQYCYATDRLGKVRPDTFMSYDTLRKVVRQWAKFETPIVRYIWHGGEPLLAGIEFFEEIVNLQKTYHNTRQIVRNSIQTNATLLTSEWAEFFAAHKFNVGVSLDGPPEVHNAFRKFGTGRDSFELVIRGVEQLKAQDVPHGFLAVVSKHSLKYPDEIFDFFLKNNLKRYELLPSAAEFVGSSCELLPHCITPIEYAEFMIRIFDRWLEQDDPDIRIRFFDNAMAGLLGGRPSTCTFAGTCPEYLTVAPNGDIYHCDWFIGQQEKCFGNIDQENLRAIVAKPLYQRYTASIRQSKSECQVCNWRPVCNGGCSYHRSIQGNFQSPYYFCESRKLIFHHMNQRLQSIFAEMGVTDRPHWAQ